MWIFWHEEDYLLDKLKAEQCIAFAYAKGYGPHSDPSLRMDASREINCKQQDLYIFFLYETGL